VADNWITIPPRIAPPPSSALDHPDRRNWITSKPAPKSTQLAPGYRNYLVVEPREARPSLTFGCWHHPGVSRVPARAVEF